MEQVIEFFQHFWLSLKTGQLPHLGVWSYFILAGLVAVEGPIATLLGAAAASAGMMRPEWVFVSAAGGNLGADTLWYSIGYAGKIDWVLSFGKPLGVERRHIDRLTKAMRKHATKILLFAKLTAGFVIPSLIAAGLARVPWRRWFPPILSAEMVWTGSLVLIGYYATQAIQKVEKGIEILALTGTIVFLLAGLWGVRRLLRRSKRFVQPGEEQDDSE